MIKRCRLIRGADLFEATTEGDWVRWEDAEKLLLEISRLKKQVEHLKDKAGRYDDLCR